MQALVEFARRALDIEPPSAIQPARGRERDRLEHECVDIVSRGDFDGQAWNKFCGNMIHLAGGERKNTQMWDSNPFADPEREASVIISRVKDLAQFNRGVISTTSGLSNGISIIEAVSFGDEGDFVVNKPIRSVHIESFGHSPTFPLIVHSSLGDTITLSDPNWHHDTISREQARQLCRRVLDAHLKTPQA